MSLARAVRSTPGHGSARLIRCRPSLTRLTEDQLSDPKGDLNVLSPPGTKLDVLEEKMIREHGGPGKLANKRHQMSEKRYQEALKKITPPGD